MPRRSCGASLPCGYAMLLLWGKGAIAVAEGNLGEGLQNPDYFKLVSTAGKRRARTLTG
ncbi:hypothetical protein [Paenibacillus sp. 1-18]|uniref:hypothetical protein n=1 Tax=Paenibacillus sp. 1-18 TaxID=1333846 RepID=UPI0012DF6FCB|nr:hypothetical protein [Paenibacillus sp. 1-18]